MDDWVVVVLQHPLIYTLGTKSCCNFNPPFELHQLVDYEGEICGFLCLFCFLVCVALFYSTRKFQRHPMCKDFHGEHNKHMRVFQNCCHIIQFFAFQNFDKMCISNLMAIL
jgi:hypothetical protein